MAHTLPGPIISLPVPPMVFPEATVQVEEDLKAAGEEELRMMGRPVSFSSGNKYNAKIMLKLIR